MYNHGPARRASVSAFAKPTFSEPFGVNRALNAEVFVAAPHLITMQFDLFGKRRSGHWVKGRRGQQNGSSGWIARSRIALRTPNFACMRPPSALHFPPLLSADLFHELAAAFHRY
jgi:hypothetical protein